ncbi:MAG TPA: S41 family peptidase [Sphingomicrobium sp.]|nr:S41 family peptidase [Sphingomicrobium sp.]
MRHRLGLALAVLAAPLAAQSLNSTEQAWNRLARADVDAALALISENHPGAASELGDKDFQERLATARANAEKRLPLVKDFYGHAALLNGLANEFRDGHVRSNAVLSPSRWTWSGIVMARSGSQWIVGAQDKVAGEPDLKGAKLVACDGVGADRFARERTGTFYAHPDIEADMARRAYTLLLDDQNPFVARPGSCRFELADGQAIDHRLDWRSVSLRNLEKFVGESAQPARAGMGLSSFGGGYWISVETFSNAAADIVAQVRARQEGLRASPTVVIDLRGNSGGNSQYAEEIARALVGDARVEAASRPTTSCTGMYWRVSRDNAAALRKFASELPADRAPEWKAQSEALDRALAERRAFSPDLPACARSEGPVARPRPKQLPPPAMTGRLVLVTDRACFSSCLMAADLFRRLGALHVGEATDMSTRYMEVREIVLPSGLRTFSTLQKVALGLGDFGPYEPQIAFPGSLAETDKLKAWVAALPR